jgi:serine/threonine protein kinase
MSPETMLGSYTTQADLWSIGVCTYMLLDNGKQPFEGKTPKQIVAKVLKGRYSFEADYWSEISDLAKDFIRGLLVVKPEDRMTAITAKQHPWMVKNESKHNATCSEVDEEFKQRVRECIVQYTKNSEFLKLALNVIAKKSTPEEIFQLRSVFDEFDTDNTGSLSLSEFKAALGQFKYTDEDLEEMFHKIVSFALRSVLVHGHSRHGSLTLLLRFLFLQDINKNNEINYTEFLAAALETQGTNLIEEHRLAEAFDLLVIGCPASCTVGLGIAY